MFWIQRVQRTPLCLEEQFNFLNRQTVSVFSGLHEDIRGGKKISMFGLHSKSDSENLISPNPDLRMGFIVQLHV